MLRGWSRCGLSVNMGASAKVSQFKRGQHLNWNENPDFWNVSNLSCPKFSNVSWLLFFFREAVGIVFFTQWVDEGKARGVSFCSIFGFYFLVHFFLEANGVSSARGPVDIAIGQTYRHVVLWMVDSPAAIEIELDADGFWNILLLANLLWILRALRTHSRWIELNSLRSFSKFLANSLSVFFF